MSSTLDKTALVRLSWLTELRRQGHRQCQGPQNGDKVCALVLLTEMINPRWFNGIDNDLATLKRYGHQAGLTDHQTDMVASMNDGRGWQSCSGNLFRKYTFAEIADVVASWFPQT